MAEREQEWDTHPPVGPHLAVQQVNGLWGAIPRYAIMALIEDPKRPDKVLPVALTNVRIDKAGKLELHFQCPCRQPDCTARWKLSGSRKGAHPQKFGEGVERLAKSILERK